MNRRLESTPLGARERQIMDILFSMNEASVSEVRERLPNPPSYSAVRTMIRLLESKGLLKHRQQGTKYIYRPTVAKQIASSRALNHLVKTFFCNSPSDAVAALLESEQLTHDDLTRIESLIQQARKEGR